MIELLNVKFTNFGSFGNTETEVDLSVKGTTFVLGKNIDSTNVTGSGAGKTTIYNAISVALFDKPLNGTGKSKLVNNINAKNKGTTLTVSLSLKRDSDLYEITRRIGKGAAIEVFKNGEEITFDSIANNNKFIEETILGMSHELFKRTVIFTGTDTPFLDLELSKQRNVIEELLSIEELSQKATKLKEEIKSIEKNIEIKDAVIKQQKITQELQKSQIRNTINSFEKWNLDQTSELASIENQLTCIQDIDFESEIKTYNELDEVSKIESGFKSDQKLIIKDIQGIAPRITSISKEVLALSDNKCPYCEQEFLSSKTKIESLVNELEELEVKNTSFQEKKTYLESNIKHISERLVALSSKLKYSNFDDLLKIREKAGVLADRYETLKNSTNPFTESYSKLADEKLIELDVSELDTLKYDLEHHKFLLKLLTDKNSFIRKKIISKNLAKLNQKLKGYISDFGLPHIVEFTSDMNVAISEYDKEIDYGLLSNGEKRRVNLSLSLAFRDVRADMVGNISHMFTDEIDGGAIDGPVVEDIIKVIRKKAKVDGISIWVISHRPEMMNRFDREINIVKENGFSRIEL